MQVPTFYRSLSQITIENNVKSFYAFSVKRKYDCGCRAEMNVTLSKLLWEWFEKKPVNTWGVLARRTGLTKSRIYQIAQNENSNATYETTKKLLIEIGSNFREIVSYLRSNFPKEFEIDLKFLESYDLKGFSNNELNLLVSNYTSYRLMAMCSSVGLTKHQAHKIGLHAQKYFEELIEREIIVYENGKYWIKQKFDDLEIVDFETLLKMIQHCTRIAEENQRAKLISQTLGLNESGIKKAKELVNKFILDISEIEKNEDYVGEIPCYLNAMFGRID